MGRVDYVFIADTQPRDNNTSAIICQNWYLSESIFQSLHSSSTRENRDPPTVWVNYFDKRWVVPESVTGRVTQHVRLPVREAPRRHRGWLHSFGGPHSPARRQARGHGATPLLRGRHILGLGARLRPGWVLTPLAIKKAIFGL